MVKRTGPLRNSPVRPGGILGVDLGGTKIVSGIVGADGVLLFAGEALPTRAELDRATVEANLFRSIEAALGESGFARDAIAGIGIGAPGPLDLRSGTLLDVPNLPTLRQYALRKRVEDRFGLPVRVDNDANCFVLGEARFGAGRGKGVVAGLTLGTGLGCGVALDGRIFRGATGTAAEIWCTPYGGGTFEDAVSNRGAAGAYFRRTGRTADAREIASRAAAGEKAALETWAEFGGHLGTVLSFLINLLDPDVAVLGGSLSKAFEYFRKSMKDTVERHVNPVPRGHVKIGPARLGDKAGLVGASALWSG
jgi:glucokinase